MIGVPEFVMNAFEPSITHSSPPSLAVVDRLRVEPPRFRERERADRLALRHRHEPAFLLFSRPVAVERVRREPDGGLERDRDRRVVPRDLLETQTERQEIAPLPADLFGERDAEQPELGHALHDLERELLAFVVAGRRGRDDLLGERPDGRLELPLLGR